MTTVNIAWAVKVGMPSQPDEIGLLYVLYLFHILADKEWKAMFWEKKNGCCAVVNLHDSCTYL